jgi:hypothetical protein
MNNALLRITRKNVTKIALIVLGMVAVVSLIGYVTVSVLKKTHAPTISTSTQSAKGGENSQNNTPPSPTQAQALADTAVTRARDKVTQGNQKDALAEYQIAYDNYKAAGNTASANDAQFAINSIKSVLAAEQSTAKPTGGKTSSKQ